MEWERAAWAGALALVSAGVAGGVAVAASKQAPPATGPTNGRGGPRLPVPQPPPQPIPVSVTPQLPPTVTTTTTTTGHSQALNYKNITLQPGAVVNGAIQSWQAEVDMVNPTSLTIQLPPGASWASTNDLAHGRYPSSVTNVVAYTSGSAPSVLTFNGTVGYLDDVIALRWFDAAGGNQLSELTLVAVAPPLQSPLPVGGIRTIPPVTQTVLMLQPGSGGLTASAPWSTTVSLKSGTKLVMQLPAGGKWNGAGNVQPTLVSGNVSDVVMPASGNSPASLLFSGTVGQVSEVVILNWIDSVGRSQQAQLSLVATS